MAAKGIFTSTLPLNGIQFPAFGQVTPTIRRYPLIHVGGERHGESKVFCPRTRRSDRTPPENYCLTLNILFGNQHCIQVEDSSVVFLDFAVVVGWGKIIYIPLTS